jgi:hypothetical protein
MPLDFMFYQYSEWNENDGSVYIEAGLLADYIGLDDHAHSYEVNMLQSKDKHEHEAKVNNEH